MSKILIIEDEPAIRRVLVKILSEEDKSHEIDEAENGIDAINQLKKNSYDLIISDIKCLRLTEWRSWIIPKKILQKLQL